MANLRLIDIEERQGKKCCVCGATQSVKYEESGKFYCNACAGLRMKELEDEHRKQEQIWREQESLYKSWLKSQK